MNKKGLINEMLDWIEVAIVFVFFYLFINALIHIVMPGFPQLGQYAVVLVLIAIFGLNKNKIVEEINKRTKKK